MGLSTLYILFVVCSILLFNALILLARFVRQVKMPPSEMEYESLKEECSRLESKMELQNAELLELQMQVKDLEGSLQKTQEASAGA